MDISIIIPSRNETYLNNTLEDILVKAETEIEIFVNIDGNKPLNLVEDKRITYFHNQKPIGMRGGINLGLKNAKGKYIMKTDAHCLFAKGFDKVLLEDVKDNWLVIPRRYSLHGAWKRELRMPVKDYHYLCFPQRRSGFGYSMFPQVWAQRTRERKNNPKYEIDDTMSFQGSCYVANRKYFMEHIGLLDDRDETYSTFSGDQLEVGLKYWLGGGEVKVNKRTWYAHLFKNKNYYRKGKKSRKYKRNSKAVASWEWMAKHWMNNEEPGMVNRFEWLVEKFMPVPTWPEDRSLWRIK